MKNFLELDLIEPLQRAIDAENYRRPTPIQAQAIPPLLEGKDVLGCAPTGTGKTAAFALPVLQRIHTTSAHRDTPRALILSPTRELAAQIGESFETYGRFLDVRTTVIFGGVNEKPQIRALEEGVDVVVATPGRLLDLHGRGLVDLSHVEFFVLDEADRMLDMGFIHDIRKVLKALPEQRQNLLFSATMPAEIVKLSSTFLHHPVRIHESPDEPAVDRIDQRVVFVDQKAKRELLAGLLAEGEVERAIVFTRTKRRANRLAEQLTKYGFTAAAIHGNKSQNARERALDGFRDGTHTILVATDVASRGIDVDEVTHVFNFELPNVPEDYVHRIGRTARAGRDGTAISLCDDSERDYLRDIEKLLGSRIEKLDAAPAAPPVSKAKPPEKQEKREMRESAPRSKGRSSRRYRRSRNPEAVIPPAPSKS